MSYLDQVIIVSSSLATSASYAPNATSASFLAGNSTGSVFGTASWATNAITSAFVTASNVNGSVASALL